MRNSTGLFPLIVGAGLVALTLGCQKKQEAEQGGAPVDTTAATMTQEPSATAEAAPGDSASLGTQVYEANCQTCHGPGGKGDGPAGSGLQPAPANFSDSEWKYGGDLASITHTIENGVAGTAMIAWKGTLTDAEIEAVAKHEMAFSQGGTTASSE